VVTTLKALFHYPKPESGRFFKGMPIVKLSTTPHASIPCRGKFCKKTYVYRAQKSGSLSCRRKSAYQIVGNRTYNHFRQHRSRLNVFGMENRDVCK